MKRNQTALFIFSLVLLLIITVVALLKIPSSTREPIVHRSDESSFRAKTQYGDQLDIPDPKEITFQRQNQEDDVSRREVLDTARSWDLEDHDYRIQFEKHRSIKLYLGAPCRNYPKYQEVLTKLLENGYGIREWPEAIKAISSWSELEHHNADQMRLLGVAETDIPREMERFRNENIGEWRRCRALLKSTSGIDDDALLDELMNIPLHWPYYSDPLNASGLAFKQGEAFLEDGDWMSAAHHEALARFHGEPAPAMTISEITSAFGEEPLLINENESVFDRENISPALAPYRDDAYYENKRRLHELGEQRIQDFRQSRQGVGHKEIMETIQ